VNDLILYITSAFCHLCVVSVSRALDVQLIRTIGRGWSTETSHKHSLQHHRAFDVQVSMDKLKTLPVDEGVEVRRSPALLPE
jgi:hypothetical protein